MSIHVRLSPIERLLNALTYVSRKAAREETPTDAYVVRIKAVLAELKAEWLAEHGTAGSPSPSAAVATEIAGAQHAPDEKGQASGAADMAEGERCEGCHREETNAIGPGFLDHLPSPPHTCGRHNV